MMAPIGTATYQQTPKNRAQVCGRGSFSWWFTMAALSMRSLSTSCLSCVATPLRLANDIVGVCTGSSGVTAGAAAISSATPTLVGVAPVVDWTGC